MRNPDISIIVPVYNAENYLDRCVQSLLNQTHKSVEIILVDDGSTDKSGTICDKFAIVDKRVKVLHKENGGLSSARNFGLIYAEGMYISFVDADDYMELDTYEKLYSIIKNNNPDCIDFGWKYINDFGEVSYNLNGLEKNSLLDIDVIKNKILPPLLNLKKDEKYFIHDFSTNKIYKKSIINEYSISFDENRRTWEDRVFLVQYLQYCNTYYSLNECFYNYVSTPNSLSRQYDLHFFELILQNYRWYVEWFGNEYDFNTQYVHNYWCHSIENMILRSLKEKENKEQIIKNIEETLSDNQVITWYKHREPENELEKETSSLVVEGKVQEAIKMYENVVTKQLKQEKWQSIKAKIYSVRKVFK